MCKSSRPATFGIFPLLKILSQGFSAFGALATTAGAAPPCLGARLLQRAAAGLKNRPKSVVYIRCLTVGTIVAAVHLTRGCYVCDVVMAILGERRCFCSGRRASLGCRARLLGYVKVGESVTLPDRTRLSNRYG